MCDVCDLTQEVLDIIDEIEIVTKDMPDNPVIPVTGDRKKGSILGSWEAPHNVWVQEVHLKSKGEVIWVIDTTDMSGDYLVKTNTLLIRV